MRVEFNGIHQVVVICVDMMSMLVLVTVATGGAVLDNNARIVKLMLVSSHFQQTVGHVLLQFEFGQRSRDEVYHSHHIGRVKVHRILLGPIATDTTPHLIRVVHQIATHVQQEVFAQKINLRNL
uniref:Uncharacterized protein n=1 Tax=Cacopsylla melanoneura TaxID=428564 RepID=A0A8D8RMJ1_9HEMI